ncbi:hypothetical protein IHO40_03495 [Wolbachia endosymbiont of Mansonella ozzardi]|nr:hypothetical protein [Wolbachia endosymbiont of Mansonella ozzardi]
MSLAQTSCIASAMQIALHMNIVICKSLTVAGASICYFHVLEEAAFNNLYA